MNTNERLRNIPQAERLLAEPAIAAFFPLVSRPLAAEAVAGVLAALRRRAARDEAYLPDFEAAKLFCLRALERLDRKRFKRVLNGTGVILHTNLGRSPLQGSFWDEAREANCGYAPVELSLEDGKRGARGGLVPALAAALVGAEDALVVNNNAAAVLLAVSALAGGREVLAARGELLRIGDEFSVPQILELAGARLVEVGAANIVDAADYAAAAGPDTALALVVRSSDCALRGFARRPSPAELVRALPPGVPVAVDQGSGCIDEDIPGETPASRFIEAGCALVCFSADKLAGGPQAGVIAGKADAIAALRSHPLYRALRPGKTVYSLLERALVRRLNGGEGPAMAARGRGSDELKKLAKKVLKKLPEDAGRAVDAEAASGGGAGPDETFPSVAIALSSPAGPELLLSALRRAPLAVAARVEGDEVLVDLAAIAAEDAQALADSLAWGLERAASLLAAAKRAEERRPEAARGAVKPRP